MYRSNHRQRLTPRGRKARIVGAVLAAGALVAGCGGGTATPTVAAVGGAPTRASSTAATASTGPSTAGGSGTATSPPTPQDISGQALAFSRCMRANGVPNFPDPTPGGGFEFQTIPGLDRSSPAFTAAQAKCHSLLPAGGPPTPGTTTHPTAQTLAKLVGIAQCMRRHGVPNFPDPRTSVPEHPFGSGSGVITDFDGAILLFPSTLNMESPAYKQATAACGVLAEKLGHGPH